MNWWSLERISAASSFLSITHIALLQTVIERKMPEANEAADSFGTATYGRARSFALWARRFIVAVPGRPLSNPKIRSAVTKIFGADLISIRSLTGGLAFLCPIFFIFYFLLVQRLSILILRVRSAHYIKKIFKNSS